jgi:catechol 2,3-dioxygenase-like lactoylglutathione lyase family enzyme
MNHASFTVSNIEKSIEFYRNILGLKLLDTSIRGVDFSEQVTGIKGADLKIAYFEANNCRVELIEYLAPKGKNIDTSTCNIGSAHICFNVDNFTKFVNNLKNNKVKFSGEVCVIPGGPNKGKNVLYFEDNDSNSIEIISNEVKIKPGFGKY